MRDLLTGLAAFLIVVLTAALAAPYFINWNAQRGLLEAQLSRAFGEQVTIGGAIDLKLLPTPYLVLDQTAIGAPGRPVRFSVKHLDLELSVTPLLHGEFDVTDARLEEPVITIRLGQDLDLPALSGAPAFRANVRFDKLVIADGTITLDDPKSGGTFSFAHVDLEASVDSLSGPFKGSGAAGPLSARTKFRFASAAPEGAKTRARLVVDETPVHPGLDFDGTISTIRPSQGSSRERFDGTGTLAGHAGRPGALVLPWRLSGPLHADRLGAELNGGELRIGDEDHTIALGAQGYAVFGETPINHVSLTGKQIDIDRLAGGGLSPGGQPVPPKWPDRAALGAILDGLQTPVPVSVETAIDRAIFNGETLSALKLAFRLGGSGPGPFRLAGEGPGRMHLALAGLLQPRPQSVFEGLFDLSIAGTSTTLAWLATWAPAAGFPPLEMPFHSISAKGHIGVGDGGFEASGLTLQLDRSALSGTIAYRPAHDAQPATLKAALQSPALDIDGLPGLGFLSPQAPLDLDVTLDARAIKVASLRGAPADAGHIQIGLRRNGTALVLDPFKVEGLGGAAIAGKAAFEPTGGRIDAKVDAAQLAGLAALAQRLAPGRWSEALSARAAAFSPAKLNVSARLAPSASGALALSSISLAGTLGAAKAEADLSPDAGGAGTVSGHATLSAPQSGLLLRQIGLPALPLDNLGPGQLALTVHGPLGGPLDATLRAALGATNLEGSGPLSLGFATPAGEAAVRLASPDMSPLLQSLAIAFPDFLGQIPANAEAHAAWSGNSLALSGLSGRIAGSAISGQLGWNTQIKPALTGTLDLDRLTAAALFGLTLGPPQPPAPNAYWPALPFGTGLVDPPAARLGLKIHQLGFGFGQTGQDAALTLDLAPGSLAIKDFETHLGGGLLTASLDLHRDGPAAALAGKLGLDGIALDLPAARGTISGALDIAGGGRNQLALIASLAGTGSAAIRDLQIPGADPTALPTVLTEAEAGKIAIEEPALESALAIAGRGLLKAGDRQFGLSLAAGVLHFDERRVNGLPAATDQPAAAAIDAALDLRKPALEVRIEETLRALPKDWQEPPPHIGIIFSGPLASPRRTGDISGFLNVLAARALARETARIEAYEFDVRERAFFNQRLQFEHARAEEIKAAAEAARREEAARKEEAARRQEAEQRAKLQSELKLLDELKRQAAPLQLQSQRPAGPQGRELPPPPQNPGNPEDPNSVPR